MGAGKSAARRNSLRRVFLAGRISRQPGVAATWGRQRWIEERRVFRMVCSSRCRTRHVQSGFSNFGEINVFGRNLRDDLCARSHTSHDAKLGVRMRDWVGTFRISSQKTIKIILCIQQKIKQMKQRIDTPQLQSFSAMKIENENRGS